jgi:lipopolysaccharide transport system permease protein
MIGLAWLLAPINTYVRDIHSLAGLATSFLMVVSPIAYTPDMVPEGLKGVLLYNPLYYMIVPWQEAVVQGMAPRFELWGVFAAMSLVAFLVGFLFFARLRSVVVDHV